MMKSNTQHKFPVSSGITILIHQFFDDFEGRAILATSF